MSSNLPTIRIEGVHGRTRVEDQGTYVDFDRANALDATGVATLITWLREWMKAHRLPGTCLYCGHPFERTGTAGFCTDACREAQVTEQKREAKQRAKRARERRG